MMRPLSAAQRRRPDWRWRTAIEIIEQSAHAADPRAARAAMLRRQDDLVRRAVAFKLAIDAGLDLEPYLDVADAYEVRTNDLPMATQVECQLLGGASDHDIDQQTGVAAEVVRAFHALFWDVRNRPALWVTSELFGGCFVGRDLTGDYVGVLHRVAYAVGWRVFVAWQTGRLDAGGRSAVLQMTNNVLSQQLGMSALTSNDPDQQVRLAGALTHQSAAGCGPGGSETTDNAFGAQILGFLQSVTTRVADPTAPHNQNLPAREPRAHEYEAQVLESSRSVSINAEVPARLPARP